MDAWNLTTADDVFGVAESAAAIASLISQISSALKEDQTREPIWEISEKSSSAGRAVVQFRVSTKLFERFFNSSDGYRGMFRRGARVGTFANSALVASFRDALLSSMPETISVHVIEYGPKYRGHTSLPRSEFLRSLDPSLAKIWYCTSEVLTSGAIRGMPTGVGDGRIDVGLANTWAAIRQDPEDCILEVKGAFIGAYGLFQLKDPELRARTLSSKGEA